MIHRLFRCVVLCGLLVGCANQVAPAEVAVVPVQATVIPSATRAIPVATPTPAATATAAPTSKPTATLPPTPTSRPAIPRVGVQVGHWQTADMPAELERFRTSTGTFAAGISELDVNLDVAQRVVALLEEQGIAVDLLPATVPIKYEADAFVTIHADGASSGNPRGFKLATPWRTSPASQLLQDSIVAEYAAGTGLPEDGAITINMRGYYAFNWRRHQHAIARTTPAVIVEMGYLTNAQDRNFLLNQPDVVAQSIVNGILRYLADLDRNDASQFEPKEYAVHRSRNANTIVRSGASDEAGLVFTMNSDHRFLPFREVNGWYEGVVRGEWRVIGWVRKDDLVETNEQLTFPTPVGN